MKLVAISDDTHKQLQLLAKSKQVSMKLLVECALATSYSGSFFAKKLIQNNIKNNIPAPSASAK